MTHEPARILVVDDDPLVSDTLCDVLRNSGFDAAPAHSGDQALTLLADAEAAGTPGKNGSASARGDGFAVMLTDLSMPGMDGMELLRTVRRRHPSVVPLVVTGYGTISTAVEAVRAGAIDYLTKPVVDDELLLAVERSVQQHALRAENDVLRRRLSRHSRSDIIGHDARMRRVYDVVEAVAPSSSTVLMCGESGVGKSLIARAIHKASPRRDKPFIDIACGSIPETLLESELFGHMKGAFTGAHVDKPGRFLAADGGTIFLDEINSASPGMQLKLLRVLQERTFEPVGSNQPIRVDVRVLLATNQPLEDMVRRGEFRQDLYYRINVVNIEVPALRDRSGDVPELAMHFLERFAERDGKQVNGFTAEAMALLCRYQFPGNVRELENIVERAVVLTRSNEVDVDDLPPPVTGQRPVLPVGHADDAAFGVDPADFTPGPLRDALAGPERAIILATLRSCAWNRQRTAEILDINRSTLYKKMKAYGLLAGC